MSANDIVKNKTAAYLLLGQEIKNLKAQQDNIKWELDPYLSEADTNGRGSHVIGFDEVLVIAGQPYKGLQRVRKESKVLNEERVMEWSYKTLSERELSDLIVTVQHIDQDVLWNLFVEDMLTKEELDELFDVTVSWAFQPTKE
jgi:hypothetical protein